MRNFVLLTSSTARISVLYGVSTSTQTHTHSYIQPSLTQSPTDLPDNGRYDFAAVFLSIGKFLFSESEESSAVLKHVRLALHEIPYIDWVRHRMLGLL